MRKECATKGEAVWEKKKDAHPFTMSKKEAHETIVERGGAVCLPSDEGRGRKEKVPSREKNMAETEKKRFFSVAQGEGEGETKRRGRPTLLPLNQGRKSFPSMAQ